MTFKQYEKLATQSTLNLSEVLDNLKFNADGLMPAIAQDDDNNEVLMMAWMNRQAIEETLNTGRVCYWSRSRQCYWRKGESSGHQQHLQSMRFDCDGDAILVKVKQTGAACHTHRKSCFYLQVNQDKVFINQGVKD